MKKQVKTILFIISIFVLGIIGAYNVDAASYKVSKPSKACTSYKYNSTYQKKYIYKSGSFSQTPHLLYDKSKKKMLYCTEDGVHLDYKTYNYGSSTVATLSAETNPASKYKYITAAIAYGDNSSSLSELTTCDTTRIATVTLVKMMGKATKCGDKLCWQSFSADSFAKLFNSSSVKTKVGNKMHDIAQKVKTHAKMPSFGSAAQETKTKAKEKAKILKYSSSENKFTSSFTDSTLSLATTSGSSLWSWSIASKDTGVSASISGGKNGKLTVSIPTKYAGETLCVRIKKVVKEGALYTSKTSDQETAVFVNEKDVPLYRYVCFKTDYIKVQKQDSQTGKALAGGQYNLYTDNKCTTKAKNYNNIEYGKKTTGSDGYAYFYDTGIKQSTYYVKEVTPPEGYLPAPESENCKAVKPNNSTAIVYKNDKKEKQDILVRKINGYTNEGMNEVKIGLYTDATCQTQANVTDPVKTTSSGQVVWKGLVGSAATPTQYYVKEVETPTGYTTATGKIECQKVEIGSENEYKTTTIYNYPYGDIRIIKKDGENGENLKDITFTLLDKDKKEVKDINGNVVKSATTNENGIVEFKNIKYGDYYIVEKNNNPAFKVNKESYKFTLNEETDAVKLKSRGDQDFLYGDVNLDGEVNDEDLAELQSLVKAGKFTGRDIVSRFAADIDKSGGNPTQKDVDYLNFYLEFLEDNPNTTFSAQYKTFTDAKQAICTKIGDSKCKLDSSTLVAINDIYEANKDQADTNKKLNETTNTNVNENASASSEKPSDGVKYALGDVNKNGSITQDDVTALRALIGSKASENELADVNSDGKIDVNDQEALEGYILFQTKNAFTELTKYIDIRTSIVGSNSTMTDAELAAVNNVGTKGTVPKEIAESSILIENIRINMKISKRDITTGDEVGGAKIIIKDSTGKTVLSYTSDGKKKEFNIPAGKYTLTENSAPTGYVPLINEISFQVFEDGTVKLLSSNSKYYKIEKSNEENDTDYDHLIIYNKLREEKVNIKVPNTGSVVAISTIIGGLLLIGGGSYIIYRKYKMN